VSPLVVTELNTHYNSYNIVQLLTQVRLPLFTSSVKWTLGPCFIFLLMRLLIVYGFADIHCELLSYGTNILTVVMTISALTMIGW